MRGKGEEPSASLNKNSKGLVRKQMLELQWRFEQRITDQKIKVYKSLSDLLESPQRDEGTPRQTHTHTQPALQAYSVPASCPCWPPQGCAVGLPKGGTAGPSQTQYRFRSKIMQNIRHHSRTTAFSGWRERRSCRKKVLFSFQNTENATKPCIISRELSSLRFLRLQSARIGAGWKSGKYRESGPLRFSVSTKRNENSC